MDRHGRATGGRPGGRSDRKHDARRQLRRVPAGVRGRRHDDVTGLDRRRQRHIDRDHSRSVGHDVGRAEVGLALVVVVGVGQARSVLVKVERVGRGRSTVEDAQDVRAGGRGERHRGGDDRVVLEIVPACVGVAGVVGRGPVVAEIDAELGMEESGIGPLPVYGVATDRVPRLRAEAEDGHSVARVEGDDVALAGTGPADGEVRGAVEEDAAKLRARQGVSERDGPRHVRADEVALDHDAG